MPMFADAYISSLGYLRPNVLFENNGELASEASARERARRARKKNPPPLSPCAGGQKIPCGLHFITATDFEEKIEGLCTGYASIRKYAFPS